jgi:hypothetical protein
MRRPAEKLTQLAENTGCKEERLGLSTNHAHADFDACLSVVIVVPTLDADHPNIVFIMSNDHAAHAIGAYRSRVNQTPTLTAVRRMYR